MKKVTLFLLKNTHHTIPSQKSYFFLNIHFSFSSTNLVFLSLYGQKCLILLNSVLFTYEIPNEIILLCMKYGVA